MISHDEELFSLLVENGNKVDTNVFTQKTDIYVNDENNGNYAGEVTISTSALLNSSKWVSYRESYIQVPYIVSVKASTADAAATFNAWYAGLKNGTYSIIDSLSIEYNHTSVQQSHSYLNAFTNYKVLSSFTSDDRDKSNIMLYEDSAGSYRFSNNGLLPCDGYFNNDDYLDIPDKKRSETVNEGSYLRKQRYTAFDLSTNDNGSLPTATN